MAFTGGGQRALGGERRLIVWTIRIENRALKELAKLQKTDQRRIVDFLENRLAKRQNPRELGEALSGRWRDCGSIAWDHFASSQRSTTDK